MIAFNFNRFLRPFIILLIVIGVIVITIFVKYGIRQYPSINPTFNQYCEFGVCKNIIQEEDFKDPLFLEQEEPQTPNSGAIPRRSRTALASAASFFSFKAANVDNTDDNQRFVSKKLGELDNFLNKKIPFFEKKVSQLPDANQYLARFSDIKEKVNEIKKRLESFSFSSPSTQRKEIQKMFEVIKEDMSLLKNDIAKLASGINKQRDAKTKLFLNTDDYKNYPYLKFSAISSSDAVIKTTLEPSSNTLYHNSIELCEVGGQCKVQPSLLCKTPSYKMNYCKGSQSIDIDVNALDPSKEYFFKIKIIPNSILLNSALNSIVNFITGSQSEIVITSDKFSPSAKKTWQLIGPGGGGRITSITEDPSNPSNLYATINVGGARRSRDGGNTWEIINRGFRYDLLGENAQRMADIWVHPTQSNLVLAAGLNGHIYAMDTSKDSIWKLVYIHPQKSVSYGRIVSDPADPNVAYVGVGSIQRLILGVAARRIADFWQDIRRDPTIQRLRWDGTQWNISDVGAIAGVPRNQNGTYFNIYSIAVNPANLKEMFFVTERGLFKGTRDAQEKITTFEPVTNGLPPADDIHGGKIIFSKDGTRAYLTVLNLCPQSVLPLDICPDSRTDRGGVFRSIDGGVSWQELTQGNRGLDNLNSNYFDIAFDPQDDNIIYLAQTTLEGLTDGTLYRSQDAGDTWSNRIDKTKLNPGWLPMDKYGPDFIAPSKFSSNVYWSIGGGKLFKGDDSGITPPVWTNVMTKQVGVDEWTTAGSEAIAMAWSFAVDPKNSDILYLPYGDHSYFKSVNGGNSMKVLVKFEDMRKLYKNTGDSGTLIVDEIESNKLYAATQGPHQTLADGGVMYSKDGGVSWLTVGGARTGDARGLPRGAMTDLLVEYAETQRNLYVANYGNEKAQGGLYFLNNVDSQKKWELLFKVPKTHSLAARDNFNSIYVGIDNDGVWRVDKTGKAKKIYKGNEVFYDMETGLKSGIIYAATNKGLLTIDNKEQIKKIVIPQLGKLTDFWSAVEVHPKNEDIIYFATDKSEILRSADRGKTWKEISKDIPTFGFVILKVDPNKDIIYAESPGAGVWKMNFGDIKLPLVDDAQFISQKTPQKLKIGEKAEVVVTIKNTGNTTWFKQSAQNKNPYNLGSQNPENNKTWGLNRIPLSKDIAPGEEASFSFTIIAPKKPGTYNLQWQMIKENKIWFGQKTDNIEITVKAAASTQSKRFGSRGLNEVLRHDGFEELIQQTGLGWWHAEFGLADYKKKGFESSDQMVQFSFASRIGLVPITSCNHPSLCEIPSGNNAGKFISTVSLAEKNTYQEFIRALVERYDGDGVADAPFVNSQQKITHWVIENEPGSDRHWGGTPQGFVEHFKVTRETIRQADPTALVSVGFSTGCIIERDGQQHCPVFFQKAGSLLDFIAFHNYDRLDDPKESMSVVIKKLRQFFTTSNVPQKLWITETNFDSWLIRDYFGIPHDQKCQVSMPKIKDRRDDFERFTARHIIKRFVTGFSLGLERIFVHKFVDDARWEDGAGCTDYRGLVTKDFTPKPMYYAYQTMSRKLEGFSVVSSFSPTVFKFINENMPVYVAWCETSTCSLPSEISGAVRVTDYQGKIETMNASNIKLSSSPIFIEAESLFLSQEFPFGLSNPYE